MPDTSDKLGDINRIGPRKPSDNINYGSRSKTEKAFSKLHVGEIVQGTIINVLSEKEVVVKLPIGNLNAYLHGKLRKGDNLYLRVMEIEPYLVLKIHGVNSKYHGGYMPLYEVTRVLDLPAHPFFNIAVKFLQLIRTTVTSDEIYSLHNNYIKLEDSEVKDMLLKNIFLVLLIMSELSIPFSPGQFAKLKSVVWDVNLLEFVFNQLEELLKALPDSIAGRMKEYYKSIREKKTTLNDLLKFFLTGYTNDRNELSELLNEFRSRLKKQFIEEPGYKGSVLYSALLQEALEARDSINLYSERMNLPMLRYIPYYSRNRFKIARGTVNPGKKPGSPSKFSFIINNENLGKLLFTGTIKENRINILINIIELKVKQALEEHIRELKSSLSREKYIIESINIEILKDDMIDIFEDFFPHQSGNLSIVV